MRISIRVGSIRVDLDGVDLTARQARSLIGYVAGIADALGATVVDIEPGQPIGFGANIERAPELPPEGWYESEE